MVAAGSDTWAFHDDGPHGGAWYRLLGTDEHSVLPEGDIEATPFGPLSLLRCDCRGMDPHAGVLAQHWYEDRDGNRWEATVGCGGGTDEGDGDPAAGITLLSEAWAYSLAGLTYEWGYELPETDEGRAYADGLLSSCGAFSPVSAGRGDSPRASHLES